MKARLSLFPLIELLAVVGCCLVGMAGARAQLPPNDPFTPVVTLTASDPMANESGDPGAFRLYRSGPTNLALNVFWLVTGSATAGADYDALPFTVNIPAGVREVIVRVSPVDDGEAEGAETVAALLVYTPGVPSPQSYRIGSPSNAVVTIQDNDPKPNHPPTVSLAAPTNGASFPYPVAILIAATAQDPDDFDYVDRVEFFDGATSLGTRTNCLPCASVTNPFMLFASLSPGEHVLTAKATDSHGASSVSDPVVIRVELPLPAVVTIRATDPNAPEPGILTVVDPGVFTISRTGNTNFALPVFYSIHGTASNGLDYVAISNQVVIPVGKASAPVTIWPLGDNLVEGTETVVLRLEDVACVAIYPPPPECYVVGTPREAVVYLADLNHSTNQPPTVNLVAPSNHSVFTAPANILLLASARDPDGNVWAAHVEFFADTNKLGDGQLFDPGPPHEAPFRFSWTNVPPGHYTITARITDEQGLSDLSEPVSVVVKSPATNHPPMVNLLSPPNGAVFSTPTDIHLVAYAQDEEDGYTVTVEFFQGDHSLGVGTFVPSMCPSPYCPNFSLTWSNVPVGEYVLSAKATDAAGAVGLSSPVHIFVRGTETNQPPKVKLTKPQDGQTFQAGMNVPLRAETLDADGYVDHIEFFADEHKIGEETRYYLTPPPPGQLAVFEFAWTNPPPGRHTLMARARDDDGVFGNSSPVTIWVAQTNPLPTVVTITAPDPIAAEGTNSLRWDNWSNAPAAFGGTNTATFIIRRSGPTNNALTVHYRIGGTASNGMDYVALPYAMTIPPGRRAVEFKLVPRDDNQPEPLETVVLGLRVPPDVTSNVPPYIVGIPARAEAVIVDNDAPRPHTGPLGDHSFHIMKPGANGSWWRIECSRDLVNWTVLGTNQVTEGALHFADPDADEETRGYYRAVPCEAPAD